MSVSAEMLFVSALSSTMLAASLIDRASTLRASVGDALRGAGELGPGDGESGRAEGVDGRGTLSSASSTTVVLRFRLLTLRTVRLKPETKIVFGRSRGFSTMTGVVDDGRDSSSRLTLRFRRNRTTTAMLARMLTDNTTESATMSDTRREPETSHPTGAVTSVLFARSFVAAMDAGGQT